MKLISHAGATDGNRIAHAMNPGLVAIVIALLAANLGVYLTFQPRPSFAAQLGSAIASNADGFITSRGGDPLLTGEPTHAVWTAHVAPGRHLRVF